MMDAANPYAPPTAHVTDVDASVGAPQPLRISSYHGRIGRLRYLAWTTGSYLLLALAGALGSAVAALSQAPKLAEATVWLATVVWVVFWVFWTIQRGHDMGWRGRRTWWVLFPLAAFIWVFKSGTQGANAYGPPPPRNTVGIHVLAWILPAFFVVGIVAAISIPAYQDYTKRVKASRV